MRFPCSAAICAILVAASACVALVKVRAQTTAIEPFVGIQVGEISPRKGDPPIPRTYFSTIAVRSDGSIVGVSTWDRSPGRVRYVRDVIDGTTKTHTAVDPVTESVVAEAYNDVQLIGRGPCEGAPVDPVEGFDVVYSESTETMPDSSTVTLKEWKAPALGCYPIKQEFINKRGNGELIGDTKNSLVHIKLGEPDPWYFSIPTNYTTRTPKEYRALIEALLQK